MFVFEGACFRVKGKQKPHLDSASKQGEAGAEITAPGPEPVLSIEGSFFFGQKSEAICVVTGSFGCPLASEST